MKTLQPQSVGTTAQIVFLVEEGQIRAKAVVRYIQATRGMGLEFVSVAPEDRPHLAALLTRLRSLSHSRHNLHDQ